MSQTDRDLGRFKAACDYPGVLDEQAVEHELAAYLRALDLRRQIVRLRPGWRLEDHPPLKRHVELVLDTWAKRHPDAADVRSALAAADGSNLEDLDEPSVDTLGPPANAAFALPEVLDGLAHAAAGKARKAYDAFDRHYGTARWILRFVLPAVGFAVFFAVFVGRGFRDNDIESAFGQFLIAAMPSDIKEEDEAALMARFAASTARTVNKFLDSIPSSRGLTSLQSFAVWCIQARGWDLSEKAPALLEARWLRKSFVMAWARPLFEAFAAGCWLIYWTEDTLYWCAKPVVHHDRAGWLHDDRHAAVESDIEELYFWHGVRVPAFVVLRPDRITVAHIDREANAEVRRVMIERYRHGEEVHGPAAFIRDAGAVGLDHDERYGTLWRRNVPGDEPIVAVEVVNSTRAPDGSFKRYWLRVPPEMSTAREAVAWTFGLRATQYAPVKET
jgi:hypothetical protein